MKTSSETAGSWNGRQQRRGQRPRSRNAGLAHQGRFVVKPPMRGLAYISSMVALSARVGNNFHLELAYRPVGMVLLLTENRLYSLTQPLLSGVGSWRGSFRVSMVNPDCLTARGRAGIDIAPLITRRCSWSGIEPSSAAVSASNPGFGLRQLHWLCIVVIADPELVDGQAAAMRAQIASIIARRR